MILTIPELKARFAAGDQPSPKDFSDFVDTVIAFSQANMNSAIAAAVAAAIANLPTSTSGSQIIVQATPPNAGAAANVWLQVDATTQAIVRAFRFSGSDSKWHARHPLPPGQVVLITDPTFSLTALSTYDGGGSPGAGAMWELVTDLAGAFPLGTAPSTSATYPVGSVGGEATHKLTVAEMPAHSHSYNAASAAFTTTIGWGLTASGEVVTFDAGAPTSVVGGNGAHNNMPPYKACYFIRRTSRLDYVMSPGA